MAEGSSPDEKLFLGSLRASRSIKNLVIYIMSARNFHNCNYFNHHKSDWSELKWSLENAQPVNLSLCVCDKFLALICYLGREIGPFPISHRFRPGPRIICQTSPPITKIKFGHPNLWMQNYLSLIHWNNGKYLAWLKFWMNVQVAY